MGDDDPALWELPIFAVGAREVTVGDVIDAAHVRGELEPCWKRLLALEAAVRQGLAAVELDESALQALSEQFRYDRDLITEEETERWLGARGLTLDDFSGYFLRRYCEDTSGATVEAEQIDFLSASQEQRDLLRVELWLSGDLDRMATGLSWRHAAGAAARSAVTPDTAEAERRRFFERTGMTPDGLPAWLAR